MSSFITGKTTFAFIAVLAACGALHAKPGDAGDDSRQEIDLLANTSGYDKNTKSLHQTSEDQLHALQSSGILPRNAHSRSDYVSYYRPTKPVFFHGARLLYWEYEYMEEFIGCCVDEGFGLILQGGADDAVMHFAAENGCEIRDSGQMYLPPDLEKAFETKGIDTGSVYELSCRGGSAQ